MPQPNFVWFHKPAKHIEVQKLGQHLNRPSNSLIAKDALFVTEKQHSVIVEKIEEKGKKKSEINSEVEI